MAIEDSFFYSKLFPREGDSERLFEISRRQPEKFRLINAAVQFYFKIPEILRHGNLIKYINCTSICDWHVVKWLHAR